MINMRPPFNESLRFKNLVYVRNLKCASTFFYENLLNVFNWKNISYQDIDWDTDHVFGHIIDPVVRRHKAVAEFVDMQMLSEEFLKNKNLQLLLGVAPYLDRHGIPYTATFRDKCYKIDWIPILDSNIDNITNTQKLLNYYNGTDIQLADWDHQFVHVGSTVKKEVERVLKHHWETAITRLPTNLTRSITEIEMEYLAGDLALYNNILNKFDATADTWPDMSWLK
jgi:hypothetical protein